MTLADAVSARCVAIGFAIRIAYPSFSHAARRALRGFA
jgi:hypothetical protein